MGLGAVEVGDGFGYCGGRGWMSAGHGHVTGGGVLEEHALVLPSRWVWALSGALQGGCGGPVAPSGECRGSAGGNSHTRGKGYEGSGRDTRGGHMGHT